MNAVDRLNERLLVTLGLSPDSAKIVMERIGDLERETANLRAQLLAGPDRALRCAFCGHEYLAGTPTHKHESLTEHIRVCEHHPVGIENRRLMEENDRLCRAYVRPNDLRAQIETLVADNAKLREALKDGERFVRGAMLNFSPRLNPNGMALLHDACKGMTKALR